MYYQSITQIYLCTTIHLKNRDYIVHGTMDSWTDVTASQNLATTVVMPMIILLAGSGTRDNTKTGLYLMTCCHIVSETGRLGVLLLQFVSVVA